MIIGPDTSILCIDPGVCDVTRKGRKLRIDGCACAHFLGGIATAVFFAAEAGPVRDLFDLVVVERPHIRGRNTPDPQTIVDLAWDGAALAYSLGAPVKWYLPQQWKGGVPKPIHHRRMWRVLSEWERALFPPGTEAAIEAAVHKGAADHWSKSGATYYGKNNIHNLLDALALGLYYIGRFDARKDTPDVRTTRTTDGRLELDTTTGPVGAVLARRAAGRDQPGPGGGKTQPRRAVRKGHPADVFRSQRRR